VSVTICRGELSINVERDDLLPKDSLEPIGSALPPCIILGDVEDHLPDNLTCLFHLDHEGLRSQLVICNCISVW
jgi:hypothetical protein